MGGRAGAARDVGAFLDTNIIIYYLTRDDEERAERCLSLLQACERREIQLVTSELVIAEAVWVLEGQARLERGVIRDRLMAIVRLPGLRLPHKRRWPRIFDLYCDLRIDFIDAYNAVIMERSGTTRCYSFDRDFDKVQGIDRNEP